MSVYTIELDGKRYDIEGDRPPTEEEARQAVGEFGQQQPSEQGGQPTQQSIPQMLLENLKQAGIKTSAQSANVLNSLLLGVPDLIAKKAFNQPFVNEADLSPMEKVAGQTLGMGLPIGGIIQGTGKVIQGANLGSKLLRGAVAGGVSGAVIPPEENWGNLQERGKNALLGSLLGVSMEGAGAGLEKVGNLIKSQNIEEQTGLARKIRQAFVEVKKSATDKFGGKLDELSAKYPNKKIDLSNIGDEINSDIDNYTGEFKNIVKKIPGVKYNKGKFTFPDEIDVKDAQGMINYLNTKVPANIKYQHLDLLDLESDLRASQLDAFPEMSAIRDEYRKVIQPYNSIKNQFKFNRLLGAINNDFGGAEGKQALEEVFKDNPKILKEMGGYKNSVKALKAGKEIMVKLLQAGAVGAGIGGAVGVGKHFLHD